jgi:adenine deaminase
VVEKVFQRFERQRKTGGFVAVLDGQVTAELPLPIAGLMSGGSAEMVRPAVATLRHAVRAMGCPLAGPLLQLSFLQLPVIRGLVDVDRFELIDP